jgi:hypothetical protein
MDMSKYTEYREIAGKMKTVFETAFEKSLKAQVSIVFNPILDRLEVETYDLGEHKFTLSGKTGLALFKTLKQIYE